MRAAQRRLNRDNSEAGGVRAAQRRVSRDNSEAGEWGSTVEVE